MSVKLLLPTWMVCRLAQAFRCVPHLANGCSRLLNHELRNLPQGCPELKTTCRHPGQCTRSQVLGPLLGSWHSCSTRSPTVVVSFVDTSVHTDIGIPQHSHVSDWTAWKWPTTIILLPSVGVNGAMIRWLSICCGAGMIDVCLLIASSIRLCFCFLLHSDTLLSQMHTQTQLTITLYSWSYIPIVHPKQHYLTD